MIVRNLQGVNMFKKIIMLLLPLFVFAPSAFADEVQDVQAFLTVLLMLQILMLQIYQTITLKTLKLFV